MLIYVIIVLIALLVWLFVSQNATPAPVLSPLPPLPSAEDLDLLEGLEAICRNQYSTFDITTNPIVYAAKFMTDKKHSFKKGVYNQNTMFALACILVRTNFAKDNSIAAEMKLLANQEESTWDAKCCRMLIMYIWYRYCSVHTGEKNHDALLVELQGLIDVPQNLSVIERSRGIRWLYILGKLGNELQLSNQTQRSLDDAVGKNVNRCNWSYINSLYRSDVQHLSSMYELVIGDHYAAFVNYQKHLAGKYPPNDAYPEFTVPLPQLNDYGKSILENGYFAYPYAERVNVEPPRTAGPIPSTLEWITVVDMYVEKTCAMVWQIVSEPYFYVYCGGSLNMALSPDKWSRCLMLENSGITIKSILFDSVYFYIVFLNDGTCALFLVLDLANNYMDVCIVKESIRNDFKLVSICSTVKNSTSLANNWEQFFINSDERLFVFTQADVQFRREINNVNQMTSLYTINNDNGMATYRIFRPAKKMTNIASHQKTLTSFGKITQDENSYFVALKQVNSDDSARFKKLVRFSQIEVQTIEDL